MKISQKKSSLGTGLAFVLGTIFVIIVIFFLFLIKVPGESKRNDTEMVQAFMTDTFQLDEEDVALKFSTFIKSEAGHYNVTLNFSPDYKKNNFLDDNLKQAKKTFYSPDSPELRAGYQFGRDYNEDTQLIRALDDWMAEFGFEDRFNVTYFAEQEINKEVMRDPEKLKETYFRLLVTSPKGWGNYLKDYYPPGKVEKPVLANFEAGKGYFLNVHFSVTEISEQINLSLEPTQEELIQQIEEYFNLKKIPEGTYFEVEYLGQLLHLWYQDGTFSELYSFD